MLSFVRRRLTFANVALTVALVFAMSGGAFAAGKFLITSTKQIKPSVLASLKGKAGAAGATGAQGPAGPAGATGSAGPAGSQGPAGPKGETGAQGTPGTNGTNGKNGTNGTTGFTETLPTGKTETGTWGAAGIGAHLGALEVVYAPISFTIPLASAPKSVVIGQEEGEGEAKQSAAIPGECTGTVSDPGAKEGEFCIFVSTNDSLTMNVVGIGHAEPGIGGVGGGQVGTVISLITADKEPVAAFGTWAVTAP